MGRDEITDAEGRAQLTTLPTDHLPSVLKATLDPAIVLRRHSGETTIVGGNEAFAGLTNTKTSELARQPPTACMSEALADAIEHVSIADTVAAMAIPSHPDHQVDGTPVDVTVSRFSDNLTQEYVLVVARRQGADAVPSTSIAVDTLTGLANREAFTDTIRQLSAAPDHKELSVAFLDLDNFKTMNDGLGHHEGDNVLRTVAQRLNQVLGGRALVARFGGDEFVIAQANPIGTGNERLGEELCSVFHDPFELIGKQFPVTASIGIVTTDVDAKMHPEAILKSADVAMYEAKRRGKDQVVVYDESLEVQTTARLELEADLRTAIDRGEFLLHYQPIMDVISGRPVGAEALVRWIHPERGMVPPDKFISIAEETGLIVPLGAWVLETALTQVAEWNQSRLTRRALSISVNLSGIQLADPDLETTIHAALSRTGFDPNRLTLEVTESVLMNDADQTMATLARFRELGIGVAIDDFGTGYSSLAYLKHMPARSLKVDKAFVDGLGTNPEDTALVAGILGLAGALGLQIVAEGVETELQLRELRRLGCEYSQGYFHSRPLPAEEFQEWIAGYSRSRSRGVESTADNGADNTAALPTPPARSAAPPAPLPAFDDVPATSGAPGAPVASFFDQDRSA